MNVGMMVLPEVICSRSKLIPHLNFRVRTASRRTTLGTNIGKWNIRTLRRAGTLENLTMEMDKCELHMKDLSEVQWPGKGEIVSGN